MPQHKTWIELFEAQVARRGPQPFVKIKDSGQWEDISWSEYDRRVRAFARALLANGFEKGQCVSILSANRWQWGVADLGTVFTGGIATGVYPTNSPEQCEYILNHSETRIMFCDTKEQTEKVLKVVDRIPLLKRIVTLDKTVQHPKVIHWDAFIAEGEAKRAEMDAELARRCKAVKEDDNFLYVYTSGTTGPPKCVQLTHKNMLPSLEVAMPYFDAREGDTNISYLPPAHVADRLGCFYLSMFVGGTIAYVSKVEDMIPAMKEVRPNAMVWVPRIFEKVYTKINAGLETAPPAKQKIFAWAIKTGSQTAPYRVKNVAIPFPLSIKHAIAKKLVYDKLNANLLGGRLRMFFSGAAPLAKEVGEFFFNLNLPVYEVWSMSEMAAIGTFNTPGAVKFGSVGKPLPTIQLKLDEDGEILVKGPNIMKGYYKNDEANKEAFTPDGFLRTGDIGRIDEDGFLYITDRKKDLIITSSGKNIAPQNIENLLKQSRWISLAMAYGDKRNFITALITLDREEVGAWMKENGLGDVPVEKFHDHPKVEELIKKAVEEVNERLANIERIKKYKILPGEFTVDGGEVTPTLKLKRKEVTKKYNTILEGFYAGQ